MAFVSPLASNRVQGLLVTWAEHGQRFMGLPGAPVPGAQQAIGGEAEQFPHLHLHSFPLQLTSFSVPRPAASDFETHRHVACDAATLRKSLGSKPIKPP